MPGLMLRTGVNAGFGGGSGTYTPMTPASASSSTANAGSISQAAYGISGTGGTTIGRTLPAYGSISVGLVCIAALGYLWWSLPR